MPDLVHRLQTDLRSCFAHLQCDEYARRNQQRENQKLLHGNSFGSALQRTEDPPQTKLRRDAMRPAIAAGLMRIGIRNA